jgi:hypothetical protein
MYFFILHFVWIFIFENFFRRLRRAHRVDRWRLRYIQQDSHWPHRMGAHQYDDVSITSVWRVLINFIRWQKLLSFPKPVHSQVNYSTFLVIKAKETHFWELMLTYLVNKHPLNQFCRLEFGFKETCCYSLMQNVKKKKIALHFYTNQVIYKDSFLGFKPDWELFSSLVFFMQNKQLWFEENQSDWSNTTNFLSNKWVE